jgi:hypothetical protein
MTEKNPYFVLGHDYINAQSRANGVARLRKAGELPAVEYCENVNAAFAKAGLE